MTIRQLVTAILLATTVSTGPAVARSMEQRRAALVATIRRQVRAETIKADDAQLSRALSSLAAVPREEFVPPEYRRYAYESQLSLPIGYDQTISDPYVVALMTAAANLPDDANVLDVGTGSGYQAAVLAKIARRVTSIEIVEPLATSARERLARLGYGNVEVRAGDGYAGAPDRAPFDAIIVAAGSDKVPQALIDQLRVGGRIVMPVGATWASEQILVMTKTGPKTLDSCSLGWTMFVPLTGKGQRPPWARGMLNQDIRLCYGDAVVSPVFVRKLPQPEKVRSGRRKRIAD